jgi:hypothetical protein
MNPERGLCNTFRMHPKSTKLAHNGLKVAHKDIILIYKHN